MPWATLPPHHHYLVMLYADTMSLRMALHDLACRLPERSASASATTGCHVTMHRSAVEQLYGGALLHPSRCAGWAHAGGSGRHFI